MGVNARPCAGVFGQHAVFVPIRALLRRLGSRVLRAPHAAGKPQRVHIRLPLLHLLTSAVRVQVDVVQIIAAREDVLAQRGRGQAFQNDVLNVVVALEGAGANRLKRRGQIEIATHVAAGFKRAFADGFKPLGQRQKAFDAGKIEGVCADMFQPLRQLQNAALVGVVKRAVADELQRGGEVNAGQRFAVIKRAIADGFQPFRQFQQRQIGVLRERLGTDGLYRRAADGFGDGQISGVAVVGGNRAGGSVKIELRFHIAVVLHNHGVFAAGLDAYFTAGIFKRRYIGIQLVVRDVSRRALGQKAEAVNVDCRAYTLKGNLAQRVAVSE